MRYILKHLHRFTPEGDMEIEGRFDSYHEAAGYAIDWAMGATGDEAVDWQQLFTIVEETGATAGPWYLGVSKAADAHATIHDGTGRVLAHVGSMRTRPNEDHWNAKLMVKPRTCWAC